MLKNKNVKKFFIGELILLFVVVFISILFSFSIFQIYSNTLIKNNNKIINNILKNHPELEEELISSLLEKDDSNIDLISKYGIDKSYIYELKELKNKIIVGNICVIIFSLFVSIILFVIYIVREHKELSKISCSIHKVLNNDYSINIREYDDSYISSLNNDVYKVISELKEQRDLSRKDKKYLEETLSDISHQLRTPLTSMYVMNDLLENDLSPNKRHEFLVRNKEQLERIEWLVTSLLKLSRLESGTVELLREKVNVYELIESAIDPIRIHLEIKEITICNEVDKKFFIYVDFHWTKEAIVNIIKNAYEYTPNQGKITINASDNPLYTEIHIIDTGCGIAKDKIPYIFDRFYKVNKDSNSIGIGLNMTKRIIREQLGEIKVESEEGHGTTFTIKIYKRMI